MAPRKKKTEETSLSRRNFLAASAKMGAGLALAGAALSGVAPGRERKQSVDELRLAVIGAGAQWRNGLFTPTMNIPGIRYRAICDICPFCRRQAEGLLRSYGQQVNFYEDYREMLAQEEGLDAVLVATPDWMHAEQAIACLQAGLHVYCEKEMSNSLSEARRLVLAQRETGKLLQIGHQRRSNPRYLHAIDRLIHEVDLLGRVTQAYAQWNRAKKDDRPWDEIYGMDLATLNKYGYATGEQFLNWRWYRKYGGGPVVDLGSHQIDLFSWVFGCDPQSVLAGGGIDYYPHHEWYDNVTAIYEYRTARGTARATYQVLTTTRHGGFFERFMGVDGTIIISEVPQRGNAAEREDHAEQWEKWVQRGWLTRLEEPLRQATAEDLMLDVRVTPTAGQWPLPVELAKPPHQPHLENFFDAIRLNQTLNCPAEVGYATAVAVLAANDAVQAGKKLEFQPEDFTV